MRTPFPTLEAAGCAFAASLAVAAPGAAASAGAPAWLGALVAAAAMAAGCLLCCAGIGEAMAARQSEALAAHYLPRLADYRLRADSLVPMGAFLHIWLCAGLAWPAIASLT